MICANGMPEPCLIQRFLWAMTEGSSAHALLSVGKYVGSVDGGLRALRAASICIGLPYTFIVCAMCLATLRSFQFEFKERTWGKGFKKSVCDVGVTVYQCAEGVEKCCNFQMGKLDMKTLLGAVIAFFAPIVPMIKISAKLDDEETKRNDNKVTRHRFFKSFFAAFAFYAWFVLILCDYAPTKDGPQEWGSIQGNATEYAGNFKYYLSNRHGYYHQFANDGADNGEVIKYNAFKPIPTTTNPVTGAFPPAMTLSKGGDQAMTATEGFHSTMVDVGDMWHKSRRIATFGWFSFFFFFAGYITYLRSEIRELYQIPGNLMEDWLCSWFWPTCLNQVAAQLEEEVPPPKPIVKGGGSEKLGEAWTKDKDFGEI
jgi:hypothetical protein